MTVAELITRLRKFPLDAEVKVCDWQERYLPPVPLEGMLYLQDTNTLVLEEYTKEEHEARYREKEKNRQSPGD